MCACAGCRGGRSGYGSPRASDGLQAVAGSLICEFVGRLLRGQRLGSLAGSPSNGDGASGSAVRTLEGGWQQRVEDRDRPEPGLVRWSDARVPRREFLQVPGRLWPVSGGQAVVLDARYGQPPTTPSTPRCAGSDALSAAKRKPSRLGGGRPRSRPDPEKQEKETRSVEGGLVAVGGLEARTKSGVGSRIPYCATRTVVELLDCSTVRATTTTGQDVEQRAAGSGHRVGSGAGGAPRQTSPGLRSRFVNPLVSLLGLVHASYRKGSPTPGCALLCDRMDPAVMGSGRD